jgi:hypothetical protein
VVEISTEPAVIFRYVRVNCDRVIARGTGAYDALEWDSFTDGIGMQDTEGSSAIPFSVGGAARSRVVVASADAKEGAASSFPSKQYANGAAGYSTSASWFA